MYPICTYSRLKDTTGDASAILAVNVSKGPATVTVKSSDGAFQSLGCSTWTKVG